MASLTRMAELGAEALRSPLSGEGGEGGGGGGEAAGSAEGEDKALLRLYPGHGAHIEDGMQTIAQYQAHRNTRIEQVLRLLQQLGAPVAARAQTAAAAAEDAEGVGGWSAEHITRAIYTHVRAGHTRPSTAAQCALRRGEARTLWRWRHSHAGTHAGHAR